VIDSNLPRVTIVGGSIGGLCAGVALRGIGADVQIFECHPGPMDTRGAGIVVQGDLISLLRRHQAPRLPTTSCRVRRYLQPEGGAGQEQSMPQDFTSWEAIYTTLRATFPDERYHRSAQITDVTQEGQRVTARIEGRTPIESDLLLAADGANSTLRRRLLPDVSPTYAGYVAWRGTLDEATAPPHLVAFFDDAFTFSEARSGGHILVYFIPGEGTEATPGRRRLNWVWYVRADDAELARILIDANGEQHHGSLPQGLTPQSMIDELRAMALREVHPMLAELVAATADPFVQTIVDVIVPRTVFGRIMLVGDAAFVVRPHTAGATAKAAYDASVLGKSLARERQNVDAGLRAAENLQVDYGNGLAAHGIALGDRWAAQLKGKKAQ
jgi:2-polyprenyl-6-methoxyphenol hydroxylase-like FAD-dependent oxidoreductase